jgi:hypothetical protein
MTMRNGSPGSRWRNRSPIRIPLLPSIGTSVPMRMLRIALACLLGVATALLVSCGSSGASLIPVGNAGPLKSDFVAVAQAAENGNGSCTATEAAILKTEQDFDALPATVDAGLRNRLREGVSKLHSDALELCKQPGAQATTTHTSPRTTTSTSTTPTTPTVTQTTTTPTTTTTTPTTSGPGGGTPAPGSGGAEPPSGPGSEQGGAGAGEGAGRGGNGSPGGAGAGGQEGGK